MSGSPGWSRTLRPSYLVVFAVSAVSLSAQAGIGRYSMFDEAFTGSGSYGNPYKDVQADAAFTRPDGAVWRIPLFWDGEKTWRVRVSPDSLGTWSFRISSNDPGLNGQSGKFVCAESGLAGAIVASGRWPGHFERQNGAPFWFMGDTAWNYFTDIPEEKYGRAQAEAYVKARASQGFNVIHTSLLSEAGDGNTNGPPWKSIAEEQINPGYFQEADYRVAEANKQGITVGIALAWGDKQKKEPFAWRKFPSLDARKRYARYIAARYSAYDTYFLISGEWHGEVRTRDNVTEGELFREFVEIGNEFATAEPHGRMTGMHPMTSHGSVREFNAAPWMSFGDYQQNYEHLHGRVLASRGFTGPVVNSEYGYFLRDQNGDGKPDKSNSYSADDMRFASWDILMAGGYLVTGFGTTYFGGRRDPGPFDVAASKNRTWEEQMGYMKQLFEQLEWWRMAPADELISSAAQRAPDVRSAPQQGQRGGDLHPPGTTYWAMADPGRTCLAYVRGVTVPVRVDLGARGGKFRIQQYNPRSGVMTPPSERTLKDHYEFTPPDANDWVILMQAVD